MATKKMHGGHCPEAGRYADHRGDKHACHWGSGQENALLRCVPIEREDHSAGHRNRHNLNTEEK